MSIEEFYFWDLTTGENTVVRTKEMVQAELTDAVENEFYELAAVLRDELKSLTSPST